MFARSQKRRFLGLAAIAVLAVFLASEVQATDFISTNFIVRDPVTTSGGSRATSTSFQNFSAESQPGTGQATSTSFEGLNGFLYFHFATSPVLSASAGNGQATLTWTASTGFFGNITAYQVGTATTSGGPYTFENAGNVTSFTKTGLTNGTTYYFKVRAFADSLFAAESGEASAVPAAPAQPSVGGGGGGGGGGLPPQTGVTFNGRAYPNGAVKILKDAQIAAAITAGPTAFFSASILNLTAGNYIFSLYGEDRKGLRSEIVSYPISVRQGVISEIRDIFIPPTIEADKAEVKLGEEVAISGQTVPGAEVSIEVVDTGSFLVKTVADPAGVYLYNFDTSALKLGTHRVRARAFKDNLTSPWSAQTSFLAGTKTVTTKTLIKCPARADLNNDCKVDLRDFSIAAYWFKRSISPAFAGVEKDKLSGDKKISIVDFSIMAYYWTG